MRAKLIHQENGRRTFLLTFSEGNRIAAEMLDFAVSNRLSPCEFSARGLFQNLVLAHGSRERNNEKELEIHEEITVIYFKGCLGYRNNRSALEAVVTAGKSDGSVLGGVFVEGEALDSVEIVLTELPGYLKDHALNGQTQYHHSPRD